MVFLRAARQRKYSDGREKDLKLLIDRTKQATGGAAVSVVAYQGDYLMAREELKVIEGNRAPNAKCRATGKVILSSDDARRSRHLI